MTNTRLTDPEVLEQRYPVRLREFGIRRSSGGLGCFSGGNGIVREIEFLRELRVSMLSQRRIIAPWGLNGGGPGSTGENSVYRFGDEQKQHLDGSFSRNLLPGDILRIETPGGGGFGRAAKSGS